MLDESTIEIYIFSHLKCPIKNPGSVVAQQQNGTIVAMASAVPPRSTENGIDYDGEMEVIIDTVADTENGATKTATTDEQKPRFCLQDVSFNVHKVRGFVAKNCQKLKITFCLPPPPHSRIKN